MMTSKKEEKITSLVSKYVDLLRQHVVSETEYKSYLLECDSL